MFDSLADRIREDEHQNSKEKLLRYLLILVVSIVLFGGLYMVVQHLE